GAKCSGGRAFTRFVGPAVGVAFSLLFLFDSMEEVLPRSLKIAPALKKRAAKIKVVLMDVDGTITDGSVTLLSQPDGSALEIKTFDAHDGQGMTLGHTAGLRMGVITGRESPALRRRMKEMSVEFVYEKQ